MTETATNKAKEYQFVVGVGDVHGKFDELGYRIRERYLITDSVICLCGDIGMGFHKPQYYVDAWKKLDGIARRTNNVILAVRGNHDDPQYFDGRFAADNGFKNVELVNDYALVNTMHDRILFVGGGISVDRCMREPGKTYWAGEPPVYDEKKLRKAGKATIVVTHAAPSFVMPKTKDGIAYWTARDFALHDDTASERLTFNKVYDSLKDRVGAPKFWVYGHYHMSAHEKYEDTRFVALDELEMYMVGKPDGRAAQR
jgi:predicted phosphodiesterase